MPCKLTPVSTMAQEECRISNEDMLVGANDKDKWRFFLRFPREDEQFDRSNRFYNDSVRFRNVSKIIGKSF